MSPDRIRPGSAGRRGAPAGPPSEPPAEADVEAPELIAPEELPEQSEAPEAPVGEAGALAEEPLDLSGQPAAPEPPAEPPAGEVPELTTDGETPAVAPAAPRHRGPFRRLYYGETRFDFVGRKKIWFAISALVIAAGLISLATRGLNLGIEFVGGTAWTVPSKTLTPSEVQSGIAGTGVAGETITILGTGSQRTVEVAAKLPKGQSTAQTSAIASKVTDSLASLAQVPSTEVSVETVGPSWGGQITQKAVEALIVFFILIAAYISIFFEWRMAIAAIIAVMHDILVTVGVYSLTQLQVTPDTVVAFLTILGYSLYDTIVVFDRVRDNVKHLSVRDRLTFSDVVNLSMNQTLARSINTSLVAIMPILAVLVLGAQVLGASTLQYFGVALLVGLLTGAYSSIFIASPLVAVLKEREPKYRQLRERLAARGADHMLLSASDVAHGVTLDAPSARSARTPAAVTNGAAVANGAAADKATNGRGAAPQRRSAQQRRSARSRPRGGRR